MGLISIIYELERIQNRETQRCPQDEDLERLCVESTFALRRLKQYLERKQNK